MSHNKDWFDWGLLTPGDLAIARRYVPDFRQPELVITSEHGPYLNRWHVIERNQEANIYFHVQVADDPERPLHDHPWDNQTVMLAGGYNESLHYNPPFGYRHVCTRYKGDVITRDAATAHRIQMLPGERYTMTQFTTGCPRRDWGFWIGEKWFKHADCLHQAGDNGSIFKYPEGTQP